MNPHTSRTAGLHYPRADREVFHVLVGLQQLDEPGARSHRPSIEAGDWEARHQGTHQQACDVAPLTRMQLDVGHVHARRLAPALLLIGEVQEETLALANAVHPLNG